MARVGNGVICGNLKECGVRVGARKVNNVNDHSTLPWILAGNRQIHFEIGRVPSFLDDGHGPAVAFHSGSDRKSFTRADDIESVDGVVADVLAGNTALVVSKSADGLGRDRRGRVIAGDIAMTGCNFAGRAGVRDGVHDLDFIHVGFLAGVGGQDRDPFAVDAALAVASEFGVVMSGNLASIFEDTRPVNAIRAREGLSGKGENSDSVDTDMS